MDAEANPAGPGRWNRPGRRPIAVGLAGALAVGAVGWANRQAPPEAIGLAAVVAVSTHLAAIDLRDHRLPNRIVGPLAAAVTAGVVLGGLAGGDPTRGAGAVTIGVLTALVLLVGHLAGGIGMGDVKYGYAAGACVGWLGLDALRIGAMATLIGAAAGGAVLLLRGADRRQRLAFGPYLVFGLVVGLVLGAGGP